MEFYVLLTVHLGIIPVNDQLDAQFFFLICLFKSFICFEQPRAHHQEKQLYHFNVWCMSLCLSGRPVFRSGTNCIPDGHLHRVTYTRRCIDTLDSPDDEHEFARNM
jgi:hypothetical protein